MRRYFFIFCIFLFLPIYLFSENNITCKVIGFNPLSTPPQVNIDRGRKDGVTIGMKFKIIRGENVIADGKVYYLEDYIAYLELTNLKEGEKLGFGLKAVNVIEKETKKEVKEETILPKEIPKEIKLKEESKKEVKEEKKEIKKIYRFGESYYGEYYYYYLN